MISHNKQVQIIAGLTGALTVGLAGAAFTLSFNSLTELARQQGLSVPVLFPLILEGGLIVFSLTALTRSLEGQNNRLQWALVIGCSLTATAFNIAHAPAGIMARVMWAIPSVILLLAFENLLTQLRYRVNRAGAAADPQSARQTAQNTSEPAANKPAFIPGDRAALDKANRTRQAAIEQRRAEVLTLLKAGATVEAIAGQVGASVSTVKADKRALNGKVKAGGQL